MIIDANMYWLPESLFTDKDMLNKFIAEIPSKDGWYGYCKEIESSGLKQIVIEKPQGYQNLNYVQGEYTLERQINDMDAAGIDKAVMKIPCAQEWLSLDFCKMFNDGMADFAKQSKGRLIPLGVIPPDSGTEGLKELERCRNELNMKGIQLSAHYGNRYLDSPDFDLFFENVNEYKMTVYVHHTPVPVQYDSFIDYNNLRRSYGRCADQTIAISRELFSGLFTKYPNLKFIHSMLGGGFFAIANMMFPPKMKKEGSVERFQSGADDIEECFKKNIYFEMSHAQPWGKYQLECAVKVLGADHIIFGTSYPVRSVWHTEGVDFVKNLDIAEEEKDMILSENAKKLYNI